eukprot:4787656-Pleurochrysis_carterae.AAC.1
MESVYKAWPSINAILTTYENLNAAAGALRNFILAARHKRSARATSLSSYLEYALGRNIVEVRVNNNVDDERSAHRHGTETTERRMAHHLVASTLN